MPVPIRQTSFAGGELAPERYGRTDSPEYQHGLRAARNAHCRAHGEWENRAGTKLVVAVKDSTKKPRLIPFVFSDGQTFVLEVGDQYIRFVTLGGQVLNGGLPYEVATPWLIADVDRLKFAQVGDVITFCHPSYQPRQLTRVSNTNWTIATWSPTPQAYFAGVIVHDTIKTISAQTLGAYDASHTYALNDIATYASVTYVSMAGGNIGNQPDINPDVWQLSTWGTGTAYGYGDCVYYYGVLYVSLQPGNKNQNPAVVNSQWWTKAVDEAHPAITRQWVVTQVYRDSAGALQETQASAITTLPFGTKFSIYSDRPWRFHWGAESAGPASYKIIGYSVYAGNVGLWGLIGITDAATRSFEDIGEPPNFAIQPPRGTNPFVIADGAGSAATTKWPGGVVYHDQRLLFFRTDAKPQDVFGSAVGQFLNFDVNLPVKDADTYDWRLGSERLEEIRSAVVLDRLLFFTGSGEWSMTGTQDEAVSPLAVRARRHTRFGSGYLDPLLVGTHVIFNTIKGNRVRSHYFDYFAGTFLGADLSAHARHLLKGRTLSDWSFQTEPHPTAWAVRDDGMLLSLTYDPSGQQPIMAWSWHDTGSGDTFERVCCVQEGVEDAVYVLVKRGATRYIERFASREFTSATDVRTMVFLDAAITFDGRNAAATTVTATTTTGGYAVGDEVDLASSVGIFAAGDVNGSYLVLDPDGTPLRLRITTYTNASAAHAIIEADVPLAYRNVATPKWAFARTTLTGLTHLEGRAVTVFADGGVQGPFTVASGAISPMDPPVVLAQIGLGYNSDGEMLDIALDQIRGNQKTVTHAILEVVNSRGLWVGEKSTALVEAKPREVADSYSTPGLKTAQVSVPIKSSWNTGGRIFWRQQDPLPLTVVGVTREVQVGGNP